MLLFVYVILPFMEAESHLASSRLFLLCTTRPYTSTMMKGLIRSDRVFVSIRGRDLLGKIEKKL